MPTTQNLIDAEGICTHIRSRTHNRIKNLTVNLEARRLLISGTASSYYDKAKVVNAAQEMVATGNLSEIDLVVSIRVNPDGEVGSGYYEL